MESLELEKAKRLAKKEELMDNIKKHSKFHFGHRKGAVLTSTSNCKAHTFNSYDRKRKALHEKNISKMVEEFNQGSTYRGRKRISKNAKRYNQRIRSKIENLKINETINIVSHLISIHGIKTNILNVVR